MADKMLKFGLKQETPIKEETKKRRDDFNRNLQRLYKQ